MQTWSITVHGSSGIISAVDTGESQFVIGTEIASDVFTVAGEGVTERHAWMWVSEVGVQLEDLGGGTLVNGHTITGRVQVECPASVQVGEVTLVVELKAAAASPAAQQEEMSVTTPKRTTNRGSSSVEELQQTQAGAVNKAPLKGEYTLVKEIARGGMGRIYFGEDQQLKRNVAVKVSSVSEAGEDPRFSKEAEVLAQLAHPNIVPIYNIGVDAQSRPFYSMKLIKGRTLQAVLNLIRDGDSASLSDYPRTTLLTIFRKVCDAMMFAHSKGILHRDLKPENIMVGEYGEVLVMDWGLAKVLGEREEPCASTACVNDTGDYGLTMEGEVMGTPQYMSPEQAEGMVAELDARSDIYSLGGILYAILTLRPPIEGATLDEVLTKVKHGGIRSMATERGGRRGAMTGVPWAVGAEVPGALQAVTLKALSTDRNKRYTSVEVFAGDIESYQNGFATSAEDAGMFKELQLWVRRNKVLSLSALVLLMVVSGFTVKVFSEGKKASAALKSLQEMAPLAGSKAEDDLRNGDFEDALRAATYAIELQPGQSDYHALRGNVLQVLVRWPEALDAYKRSLELGEIEGVKRNFELTEDLIGLARKDGEAKAKGALFEALNAQGRQYEAMAFGKELGDFWKDRKRDLSALPELVKQLEAKLLPVPGTDVLMSKTEMTVGEWKLYLRAEGLPDWKQPSTQFQQSDEHPVANVTWLAANEFSGWLSSNTGKEWRLPTNREWEAAVGNFTYPWGDYFPPHSDDGNYSALGDGNLDPKQVGVDGIFGTAPVGSFKPNLLGFYDLGGNVWEWMIDGKDKKNGLPVLRGGGRLAYGDFTCVSSRFGGPSAEKFAQSGIRLVRKSRP